MKRLFLEDVVFPYDFWLSMHVCFSKISVLRSKSEYEGCNRTKTTAHSVHGFPTTFRDDIP